MSDQAQTTTVNGTTPARTSATAGDQAVARLRDMQRRYAATSQELESARGELEAYKAKAETAETLTAEVKRLKAEIAGLGEQHATERSLWSAGLTDPDELELVKFAHGRLPEKDRPPLGAWVEGLKKDPSKAPKLIENIAGRWKSTGKTTTSSSTEGGGSRRSTIRPNRGVIEDEGGGGGGTPTQAEIDAATAAAARGDRRALNALKERMGLPVSKRSR